jgi:hypothetical protein
MRVTVAQTNEWWTYVKIVDPCKYGLSKYMDWLTLPRVMFPHDMNVGDEFELSASSIDDFVAMLNRKVTEIFCRLNVRPPTAEDERIIREMLLK